MIVGTAGHIDHGKTTLVWALTGVDTDRLPEEKQRGISIELGYAFLDLPPSADEAGPQRIGFIDVPGHERLVATMLSGATGIDYALLLVAADDGVMPQTREHLAVLSLLGVDRGAVVVTKADRASDTRIAEVCREVRALTAATPLAAAPVAVVSATSGAGIASLRELLGDAARGAPVRDDAHAGFRLAIDRAFTLKGTGTVVTGTAHAGTVSVGDSLRLVPSAGRGVEARVRSIHAQNRSVQSASAGQRVALALHGIEHDAIERGTWLVDPRIALETERIDVRLEVWPGEAKALRSGALVHVHVGASDVLASVAVLDRGEGTGGAGADAGEGGPGADAARVDHIAPGASGRVQLVLRKPIAAWHGDRVVLRDAAASRTLAGGTVLDPFAPARYRRTPERLAALDAAENPMAEARLAAKLAASVDGLDLDAWFRAEGRVAASGGDGQGPAESLPAESIVVRRADGAWLIGAGAAERWRSRLVDALDAFHAQRPEEPGPDAARLRRLVAPRLAEPLWRAVLDAAMEAGSLLSRGGHLLRPQHLARLSAVEQRIADKVLPRLVAGAFDPPWVRTLAADTREPEPVIRAALARLAQRGEVHQVVKDLYYPPATMRRAAALVREIAVREGAVTAASFRDATGLGRKRAIQLVEYFDSVGLLRRVGDLHRLRADCDLFTA